MKKATDRAVGTYFQETAKRLITRHIKALLTALALLAAGIVGWMFG